MFSRTKGLSLLEVLLALSMSLFLIATLTHLYLQHHRSFLQQQRYLDVSESALKVIGLLQDEINMAGHVGCARLSADFHVRSYQGNTITIDNSLVVSANELSVRYQSYPTAILLRGNETNRSLLVGADVRFSANQLLLIADCVHAEIFSVKSINVAGSNQRIAMKDPLFYRYAAGAEIGHLVIRSYMTTDHLLRIENNGRHEIIQSNIQQLHFQRNGHDIRYSFKTLFNQIAENWYGYAAKE